MQLFVTWGRFMKNSVSFLVMPPLNLRQTVFPKALRKDAFILCLIRPRWAFTVISLMPSSLPTCLFNSPLTTNAITCRSRRLNDA
jgi:hypothetical protein